MGVVISRAADHCREEDVEGYGEVEVDELARAPDLPHGMGRSVPHGHTRARAHGPGPTYLADDGEREEDDAAEAGDRRDAEEGLHYDLCRTAAA